MTLLRAPVLALLPLALSALLASSVAAQAPSRTDDDDPRFATGAAPIAPEDYKKLPKMGRFRAFLAPKVDLSDMFPPPSNQGSQPSCVAWASAYAARSYLYGREIGRRVEQPVDLLSPAYIYNSLRTPGPACNSPIPIQRALDFMKADGVVSLADYPYDEFKCGEPDKTLASKALRFRIADWRAIDRVGDGDYWDRPIALDDVKGALSRGAPVIFAMPVTSAFFDLKPDAIYKTDVNNRKRYHAMVVVGYDEAKQAVRVINSWGQKWADGGFGWIDYDTFKLLVGEAYALEAPPVKPAPPAAETPAQTFERLRGAMSCANVTLSTVRGVPTVSGYAGDIKAMADLQAAALAAWPNARWQVAHHPWPQCEADMTLAGPLAGSAVTIAALTEQGKPLAGDPVSLHKGDRFGVTASTTADKPYLSIIYLQADGSAVELYRGQPQPDRKRRLTASIGTSGGKERRFEVSEPLGHEVIIAIASAQPLFGPELKTYETERQFLTALRGKLTTVPAGSVSAAMLRVLTQ
jgi:hypothetical protein